MQFVNNSIDFNQPVLSKRGKTIMRDYPTEQLIFPAPQTGDRFQTFMESQTRNEIILAANNTIR
jgi:hypothetical protein